MAEEEPQHWTTERMITEGHAEYATEQDLNGLMNPTLNDIAKICEVSTYAPDECIPCLAAVLLAERIQAAEGQESAGPGEESIPFEDAPEFQVDRGMFDFSLRSRIVATARLLSDLTKELPPVDVSEQELALLVVAAQRWIKITDAQGVELAPAQVQILDATKALVARLNHG